MLYIDKRPEMLIGQDNCHLLYSIQIQLGKIHEPSATLTRLGWCLHGVPQRVSQVARHGSATLKHVALAVTITESCVDHLHEEV